MSILVVKGILGSPYMGVETKGSPEPLDSWRILSPSGKGAIERLPICVHLVPPQISLLVKLLALSDERMPALERMYWK